MGDPASSASEKASRPQIGREGRVVGLSIYPTKSLRGFSVSESLIALNGPVGDREFVVTDENGKFLSQRNLPRMALLSVFRDEGGLHLRSPDAELRTALEEKPATEKATVWNDTVPAVAVSAEADRFLSEALGRSARLFQYRPEHPRLKSKDGIEFETRFTDATPILLTTGESLVALSDFIEQKLEIERFRPNLHVTGFEPWAEESWQRFRVGTAEFEVVVPCSRCKIITIDPQTAEVGSSASLVALKNGVKGPQPQANFGIRCRVLKAGIVRLGDSIQVL